MSQLLIIPSIDIKHGKTVRVVQGIPELNCHQYGNDPVEMAMIWRTENAKFLHIVDFDLSQKHEYNNLEVVREICQSVIIPVEFGGGIASYDDASRAMDLGITRMVIGSLAYTNRKEFEKIVLTFGASRISAAIDVMNDHVLIKARKKDTHYKPIQYAQILEKMGVVRVIVTDVSRNGMLKGANIDLSKSIAKNTNLKVTHSGGITDFSELKELAQCGENKIDSVIIGRALYENKFPCQRLWRVAEAGLFD